MRVGSPDGGGDLYARVAMQRLLDQQEERQRHEQAAPDHDRQRQPRRPGRIVHILEDDEMGEVDRIRQAGDGYPAPRGEQARQQGDGLRWQHTPDDRAETKGENGVLQRNGEKPAINATERIDVTREQETECAHDHTEESRQSFGTFLMHCRHEHTHRE